MKKIILFAFTALLLTSCGSKSDVVSGTKKSSWNNFNHPQVNFVNKAGGTTGWEIYNRIIPNPDVYIKKNISEVVQTLYWSSADSIPNIQKINYTIEDVDGISAKGGGVPEISIFYSSRWVEKSEQGGGDDKVLFETRGVLLHELTHGYQLEPQGIGNYGSNKTFWAFIEGMADAVRAHNGGFPATNRKPGGNWMDGYQTTGFFLQWLTTKDADFLRKFNKSTLEVVPWSFDGAIKHVLGKKYSIDGLWNEYQAFLTSNKKS